MTTTKTYTELRDARGEVWASGEFTATRIRALIRSYAKLGIELTQGSK
jgi:hypothetical protein